MILLWGVPGDSPMAAVRSALRRLGRRAVFVDQHDLLETEVELRVGSRVEGRIATSDGEVDLADVEAVYLRPYDIGRFPTMVGGAPAATLGQGRSRSTTRCRRGRTSRRPLS